MAGNVTSELILDHVKQIQRDVADRESWFACVEGDLKVIRAHLAGLVQSGKAQDAFHVSVRFRLERIERRLELSDAPAE